MGWVVRVVRGESGLGDESGESGWGVRGTLPWGTHTDIGSCDATCIS